tara:strand:+ start:1323 stop:1622 length:300 start_codon:yes stop_codon:yes gene_type:complete
MESRVSNREYIVYDISEINTIDFSEVLETSRDTIVYSVDGTKSFVKWEGDVPQCVEDLKSKTGPYTHAEMRNILQTAEWDPDAPKDSLWTRVKKFFGFG